MRLTIIPERFLVIVFLMPVGVLPHVDWQELPCTLFAALFEVLHRVSRHPILVAVATIEIPKRLALRVELTAENPFSLAAIIRHEDRRRNCVHGFVYVKLLC